MASTRVAERATIELRVLGSVDLSSPDKVVAAQVLSQPKRLALLAYLAAATPRGFHARDTLLALFWPELDQEHARAALRNTLHFLRRALGEHVIVTRGDDVGLDTESLWCDAAEFEAALDTGATGRALALYRGGFLKGLHVSDAPEFDHWMDAERGRLRRRARAAAWTLVDAEESASNEVAATHWMRVALDIYGDDEADLQRLLCALDKTGDRAGAIREYERFARRMATEYAVEPSGATRALVEAIRARGDVGVGRLTASEAGRPVLASLVVLPFENLSSEPETDHVGDGLTEELIVDLSAMPGVRVIARTTSARFKSAEKDARAIGEELNVQYAVEGSVRRSGNGLRVAARLVDTATGAIVWAEKYVGVKEDVFDIEERLASAIADKLELTQTGSRARGARTRHQGSVYAYDCYHRALQELAHYSEQGLTRALQHVHNGLAIVGQNELLLSTMAYVYIQFLELGVKPDRRYLAKAEECAARALRMNPRSCLGHVVQGLIRYKQGHVEAGAEDLKRALGIDPNQRDALFWLSVVCLSAGREAAASPLVARLLEIDPLTPINHVLPGYAELLQGRPRDALPGYRKMYEMDSGHPVGRWFLALVLGRDGRTTEAICLLDDILRDTPDTTFARHALFLKHALQRNRRGALEAATPELLDEARWDQHASWWMAATYALIDETDPALEWLGNASRLGYINYPFLSRLDPFLENLRRDERFWQLMDEVRVRWERFTP